MYFSHHSPHRKIFHVISRNRGRCVSYGDDTGIVKSGFWCGDRQEGFVAIVSAVIVTAFLLGSVVLIGSSGFSGYLDTQAIESKGVGFGVAESCLRHALLYLAGGSYAGGEVVSVGSYTCHVLPIEFEAGTITIKASSVVRGSVTNLRLVVDSYNLEKVSFMEVGQF